MAAAGFATAMQTRAMTRPGQEAANRRFLGGTPEIFFPKTIDNSRLVKVADPKRKREMAQFVGALCVLFLFTMVYLWQHFSAIEYGYRIEQAKATRDNVVELNRALRLEQASLRDPERIDALARSLGFQTPQAGQVQMMDTTVDTGAPILASARISVVSSR